MRINEVEARTGLPKKTIRYYEAEGLLHPARDAENDYRNYTEANVRALKHIKVYRKLSLPVEEIGNIMTGKLTTTEALQRQKIALAHQRNDIDIQIRLCEEMIAEDVGDAELDADAMLERMARMEQEGVRFTDFRRADRKRETRGVWLSAVGFTLFLLAFAGLMLWANSAAPLPLGWFLFMEALCLLPAVGVFIAGFARIKEIKGGEEDDLSQY